MPKDTTPDDEEQVIQPALKKEEALALTPRAKEAIRGYMIKYVVPLGTAFTLLSGFLGYELSSVAKINALQDTIADVVSARVAVAEAEAKANDAATAAGDAQKKASDAALAIANVKDQVSVVVSGNYVAFAKALFDTDGFKTALQSFNSDEIKAIQSSISALQQTNDDLERRVPELEGAAKAFAEQFVVLKSWSGADNMLKFADGINDGSGKTDQEFCADGQYVMGIETRAQSDNGTVHSVALDCRPLHIK